MKAYVVDRTCTERPTWKLTSVPDPSPQAGEVLVRVRAASLNYRDLMVAQGKYGGEAKKDLVPLADGAGEVVAAGAGVTGFRAGDRVVGAYYPSWWSGAQRAVDHAQMKGAGKVDGLLAEYVTFPERGVAKIPDTLSFDAASTLPCAGVTAWNALFVAGPRLEVGDSILVQGTGGVSLIAAQLGRAAGLRVIATSSSPKKLERLRALGVTDLIDYKKTPEWQEEVLRLTDGVGVDHTIEVGGSGTLSRSFQATRAGGTISLIGILTGFAHQIDPLPILFKNLRLQGISVGSVTMLESLVRTVTAAGIEPVVDEVIPFARAPEALTKLEAGSHFGKLVVRID